MKDIKTIMVIMSHLSDAQECSVFQSSSKAAHHINFAKYLILKYSNTDTVIDADAEYEAFEKSTKVI
jgi:hypothetical protein